MSHNDFRYVSEAEVNHTSHGPLPVTPEEKAMRKPNELARRAATLCWQISSTEPVANWKSRIEAAPEELRECLREYLKQRYRTLQDKAKRQAARDSEVAKAEMAKLKTIAEGL